MVVAALTCIVAALERPASDSATRVTTGGTASPSAGARRMLVALKTATSGVQGGLAGARLLFAAASFREASARWSAILFPPLRLCRRPCRRFRFPNPALSSHPEKLRRARRTALPVPDEMFRPLEVLRKSPRSHAFRPQGRALSTVQIYSYTVRRTRSLARLASAAYTNRVPVYSSRRSYIQELCTQSLCPFF